MNRQLRPLALYVSAVILAAITLTAATFLLTDDHSLNDDQVVQGLVLAAMIAGAHCLPIQLAPGSKVVVDTAAIFAVVLLLPPVFAVAAAGAGIAVGEALRRGHPLQYIFGLAEAVVGVSSSALIYHALQPDGFGSASTASIDLLAIGLAAVVIYLLNVVLVDTVVALTIGFGSLSWSMARHRMDLPQQVALYFLGLFAALTAYHYPLTLPLLLVPAFVVYISLRDGQYLRRGAQQTMESLADIVDLRDHYTYEHSTRVANLARAIAAEMKLPPEEIEAIYMGARIHDVGKIGIKGQILLKEGPLSEADWKEMKTHPEVGAQLVSKFPDYTSAARLVLAHHERYDGRGYPNRLKGKDIPLGARIISVSDCFDAMTSGRPYRGPLEIERAVVEIRRNAGKQFDPNCVDALLEVLRRQGALPGTEPAEPRGAMTPEPAV